MQRIWLKSFVAVLSALTVASMASAQDPLPATAVPQPMPSIPQPMPSSQSQYLPNSAPVVPAQAAATPVAPVAAPVNVAGGPGCGGCGAGTTGYGYGATARGAGCAPIPYAEYCPGCANGCGSFKSDLGFIFGSCKSFFNPCGPIPCGSGRGAGGGLFGSGGLFGHGGSSGSGGGSGCGSGCGGLLGGRCPTFPFGKPYGMGYNSCAYPSYLNH